MKFLLDTNTISYAIRAEGRVGERLMASSSSDLVVSAISVAELRFGAHKRASQKLHRLIDAFLEPIREVAFDSAAANQFGWLAGELRRAGTPIGNIDTMIAAHAMVLEVTLVTRNVRHFRRVEGLAIADWY